MLKILFLFTMFFNLLLAETIDDLLKVIEIKSDLSEKTKLQNGGISFIFTRSDIERMQVNKLKDILISLPGMEYKESSYGFPDLFTYGDNKAFISNNVRVFIDNQEIATGMYGSGFMLLGDMDLDFIDHIEVYLQNPSYEYTTESTLMLIKLYTKKAKKDNGGKFKLSHNNYNSNAGSVYYSDEFKSRWNYFSYFSYDENKRKKYKVNSVKVSRDYPTYHALASIYNQNNRFLLQVISQKKDSFLDTSIDLTPKKAKVDSDFIHFGYDGNYKNFYLLLDFDHKRTNSDFRDDVEPKIEYNYLYPIASQISTIDAYLYNSELKYKYTTDSNVFITGIKYRYKTFKYSHLYRNGIALPKTGNDKQIVSSAFIENQYFIQTNSILNIGLMGVKVKNNASLQNNNLYNYRISHTYTNNNYIFKTIVGHSESSIDPYLVNSTGFFIKDKKVDKIINNNIAENIIYSNEKNRYELIISYNKLDNYLIPSFDRYLLYNYKKDINMIDLYGSYKREYNKIDNFLFSVEYQKFRTAIIDKFKKLKLRFRNLNSFKKYDLFNEFIYTHTNDDKQDYFLYNLGIKYHYSPDLIISLKGENILDDSYKQYYMRADKDTLMPQAPLKIAPIDRTFILSMEYYF